jgi:putative salt-induced outer membrane protein YdiY
MDRKTYWHISLMAWCTLMWLVNLAAADEVRLENGSLIKGKVVRLAEGLLVFKIEHADEAKIDWQKVVYLKTDDPVWVLLQDGSSLEGRTFTRETFFLETQTDEPDTIADIEVTEVTGIETEAKPKVKITARANVGISKEQGNTDTENIHVDAELIARTTTHRFTAGGELNREDADGDATARNWRAYGKYDYFWTEKWFLYGSALFENDDFADLDLRTTLGGGAGYQFFESDELNLSVSTGVGYVYEDFIVAEDDDFSAAQWLIRYDQYFFNRFVQLFHDNRGYISLEDSDNWLINTRQGIRFPVYRGLTFTFQYDYDYDNQPSPEAISKWDSRFLFLVGYHFEN